MGRVVVGQGHETPEQKQVLSTSGFCTGPRSCVEGLVRVRERFSGWDSVAQPHSPCELQMREHGCLNVRSRLEVESEAVVSLEMLTGEASTARRECCVSSSRH